MSGWGGGVQAPLANLRRQGRSLESARRKYHQILPPPPAERVNTLRWIVHANEVAEKTVPALSSTVSLKPTRNSVRARRSMSDHTSDLTRTSRTSRLRPVWPEADVVGRARV